MPVGPSPNGGPAAGVGGPSSEGCNPPSQNGLPVVRGVGPDPVSTARQTGTIRIVGENFQSLRDVTTTGPLTFVSDPIVNEAGSQIGLEYEIINPGASETFTIAVTTACGSTEAIVGLTDTLQAPPSPQPDQSFRATGGAGTTIRQGEDRAQTFRVGVTGTLLFVQVWLNHTSSGDRPTEPILADIRSTEDGVPSESDDDVLGSATIPSGDVSVDGDGEERESFGGVSFAVNVPVSQGDMLAIVLRSATAGGPDGVYRWQQAAVTPSDYVNGDLFRRSGPGPWSGEIGSGVDVAFRTFVVPEQSEPAGQP